MGAFSDRCRTAAAPLLDAIARRLTRLGVTPNGVTLAGALPYIVAAWLILEAKPLAAGLVLAILAPLDAVDGAMARLTGRVSRFGAFLDSTMDRIEEIMVYGALMGLFASTAGRARPEWFWPLTEASHMVLLSMAALGGSLMVSYTRARAEGLGIECKVGVLTRFERLVLLVSALITGWMAPLLAVVAALSWFTTLQRIHAVWRHSASDGGPVDERASTDRIGR